jgi:hypothetical protein
MKMSATTVSIRKEFILIFLSATSLFNQADAQGTPHYSKNELVAQLIRLNDESIPKVLASQLTTKNTAYYGAVFDGDSVVSPIGTSLLIQTLMCSYVSRDSKYYQSKELLERMTLAGIGLLNLQHEDGTIDLLTTNFHSTPDLGFTIYPVSSLH